jgi:hypothetical protein
MAPQGAALNQQCLFLQISGEETLYAFSATECWGIYSSLHSHDRELLILQDARPTEKIRRQSIQGQIAKHPWIRFAIPGRAFNE